MSEAKKTEKVVAIRKGEAGEKIVRAKAPARKRQSPTVSAIRRTCAWVVLISLVLFSIVSIVSIWTDYNEVMDKAWGTLLVISAVAGIIAAVAPLIDQSE